MGSMLDLCGDLSERAFAPGDVLLEEGARSGRLYLLIEGAVEVVKGDVHVCTVREPGAMFGEISMLLDIPHTATVRAVTACRVHEVDQASAFLRSHQDITYELGQLLAQRLHSMTTYLVDLKRQYEGQDDHLGMVDAVLETLTHQQIEPVEFGSDRDPDASM